MRKIFIDCGYNEGQTTKKFKEFLDNDFEYFAFEANPYLFELFKDVNPFSNVQNKAVWIENTILPFYIVTMDRHGNKTTRTGASTLIESKSEWNMSIHKEQEVVTIPSIDFSEFVQNTFDKDDYIIVKLDVEGAEYSILQRLIDTGVILYVNELYVEFHDDKVKGFSKEKILEQLKSTNIKVHKWH